jgi:magnesium-transporting ATPase (P-type)
MLKALLEAVMIILGMFGLICFMILFLVSQMFFWSDGLLAWYNSIRALNIAEPLKPVKAEVYFWLSIFFLMMSFLIAWGLHAVLPIH